MSLLNDLKRSLVNAEELGNTEWADALKARIADLEAPEEPAKELADMSKAELVAEAEARGLEVSGTKAEILAALEEGE